MRRLQKIVSIHALSNNHFNLKKSLPKRINFKLNRGAASIEWRGLLAG
jgi:putative transposase